MGRKSKAEERKLEILEHYFDVIVSEGFENASIAKIAARMEVQPSLIMHYFKTKDEMVIGVMEYFLLGYVDEELSSIFAEKDLHKRLQYFIENTFGIKDKDKRLRLMMHLVRYLSVNSEIIHTRSSALFKKYRLSIAQQFREFYENGVIMNEDSETLTDFFIMIHTSLTQLYEIYGAESGDFLAMQGFAVDTFKEKLQINYNIKEEENNV